MISNEIGRFVIIIAIGYVQIDLKIDVEFIFLNVHFH